MRSNGQADEGCATRGTGNDVESVVEAVPCFTGAGMGSNEGRKDSGGAGAETLSDHIAQINEKARALTVACEVIGHPALGLVALSIVDHADAMRRLIGRES